MSAKHESPWASGPAEILKHAISLLRKDSDPNRRIALLLIDNAVEQAIKTYLSLPKRITGISISRRQLAESSGSFPALLDALEEYASEKIAGIDLGLIEWYHHLRNELYHQGFGLTVERDKVEIYAELAQILYRNLFDHEIRIPMGPDTEMVGRLVESWNRLEIALWNSASNHVLDLPRNIRDSVRILRGLDFISQKEAATINEFRQIRNQVVHAHGNYKSYLNASLLDQIEQLTKTFEEIEGIEPKE